MSSPPLLTVVIPIEESEEQLRKSLDSVLRQSHSHLEILVVDSGSPGGARRYCDELGADDPRLTVLERDATRTSARNVAASQARGDYLCFPAVGDIVQPQAFETLLNSAARGNAQIATGTIDVVEDGRSARSWQHRNSRSSAVRAAGLKGLPALVFDTTVSNKVFRRDFFQKSNAVFAGDEPFDGHGLMLELMLGASTIEVLPQVVIHRPAETAAVPFEAAVEGVDRGLEILREDNELRRWYYLRVFEEELFGYSSRLLRGDTEFDRSFRDVVQRLWPAGEPELLDDLSVPRRAFFAELVRSGPQAARDLQAWCSDNKHVLPVRRSGNRLVVDRERVATALPELPDWVWSLARESRVEHQITAVNWVDRRLRLRGWALIPHDDARSGQSIELSAVSPTGERIELTVNPSIAPEFAQFSEGTARTFEGTGFEAWLAPGKADALEPGVYVFELTVHSGGLTRSTRTTKALRGGSFEGLVGGNFPRWRRGAVVGSDLIPLGLQIANAYCVARSVALDGRQAVVTFDVAPGLEPKTGIFKHDDSDDASPATVSRNDDGSFTLRGDVPGGHGRGWYTRMPIVEMVDGKKFQIDMPRDCDTSVSGESEELYPLRSRHGRVTIVDRRGLVLIDDIQILPRKLVRLTGTAAPHIRLEFGVHTVGDAPVRWARADRRGWEFEVILDFGSAMDAESRTALVTSTFAVQVRDAVETGQRPDRPWWLRGSLEFIERLPAVSHQLREKFDVTVSPSRELRVTMTPFARPR